MSQSEKAERFKSLHVPGTPLVLYNIWDAGSARTVAEAGAAAIATGSWSVAAAQGYGDGEQLPLDLLLSIVGRIVEATSLPVSVDFEGGYADDPEAVAANVARVMAAGAIGINFEDQVVGGEGLYPIADQAARITAIRKATERAGVPLFINARTDLFLKTKEGHDGLVDEALARAHAYAEAGADGFFVPGLVDTTLIQAVCRDAPLPVNVLMIGPLTDVPAVAATGAARASFGPVPYRTAMGDLTARYKAVAG